MFNRKQRITSFIKQIWNFLVGISGIVGCIFTIFSCYIAYNAVSEIIELNIAIGPIMARIQKDSIIVIERIAPIDKDSDHKYHDDSQKTVEPSLEPRTEPANSTYLSPAEIEDVRKRRDTFYEKMRPLFDKNKINQFRPR